MARFRKNKYFKRRFPGGRSTYKRGSGSKRRSYGKSKRTLRI